MAMDRQGTGLAIVRICLGLFFLSLGSSKYRWFLDSSILSNQLGNWAGAAAHGSLAHTYLERFAIPGATYFARLVPLGEICCGMALFVGYRTTLFAFIAFAMALNFDFASGMLLSRQVLTNGYGLPVLGSTLGLALGGARLPLGIRSGTPTRATSTPRS